MTNPSIPKMKWQLAKPDQLVIKLLSSELSIPEYVASVLIQRGITSIEQANQFLSPSIASLPDPFLLPDMDKAVERIRLALKNQEKLLICGDYDVDGITSVALLKKCLFPLGLEIVTHLPNRLLDGYGFHLQSVEYAINVSASLIITVDCGITSREAVESAKQFGIDVIITDHHVPNDALPDAYAVINPKRQDSVYPDTNLAGIGVAFKFIQALIRSQILEYPLVSMLELVALGTVADVAPLTGENRVLVHFGLEALRHTTHPGLKALIKIAGIPPGKKLDPVSIGFQIGPRINAVGRLGSPQQALNLLTTESAETAAILAEELNYLNSQRQSIEESILKSAEKQIEDLGMQNDPFLVIAGEQWHEGVIGIVASKLTDKYYRPTCVISYKEGIGKGSGRSIPTFSLFDCLCEVKDLLIEFGGHHIAAGFRIQTLQIPIFREKCCQIASQLITPEDTIPILAIDDELSLRDLSFDSIRLLEKLSPFGLGNPKPRFLFRNLRFRYPPRTVGSDSMHLKAQITDGEKIIDGIAFGFGKLINVFKNSPTFDLVAVPEINVWNSREIIQLNILDFVAHS